MADSATSASMRCASASTAVSSTQTFAFPAFPLFTGDDALSAARSCAPSSSTTPTAAWPSAAKCASSLNMTTLRFHATRTLASVANAACSIANPLLPAPAPTPAADPALCGSTNGVLATQLLANLLSAVKCLGSTTAS
ncbi:hypothetical protein BCR44DRAFT_1425339 [Catenaria anguillulae PL171]|uniref:Uncharacterized protein n=1 Tax=Catenaria anguillulae PL171 TaxID=765915 RepID=A0A1Y2I155_9FUNG|nr:hypothetical protein BCR44DRAFT_1425339 [Catenaria anguillulae PL171]